MRHSYASFDICTSNIVLCKWKRHQRDCWEGINIPPHWIPACFSLSAHCALRRELRKRILWKIWQIIYSGEFTEDVHSRFFTRKCEQQLSGLSHGCQATMFTISPWQKHPKRAVVLCIVRAFIVIIQSFIDLCNLFIIKPIKLKLVLLTDWFQLLF